MRITKTTTVTTELERIWDQQLEAHDPFGIRNISVKWGRLKDTSQEFILDVFEELLVLVKQSHQTGDGSLADKYAVVEALGTDVERRLEHILALEAHDVSDQLVQIICRISSSGTMRWQDVSDLRNAGIDVPRGTTYPDPRQDLLIFGRDTGEFYMAVGNQYLSLSKKHWIEPNDVTDWEPAEMTMTPVTEFGATVI